MAAKRNAKKCLGRTPGNVLTSYPCTRNARPGSDWCYSHDPDTQRERLARAQEVSNNRRLEREQRERIARGQEPFGGDNE